MAAGDCSNAAIIAFDEATAAAAADLAAAAAAAAAAASSGGGGGGAGGAREYRKGNWTFHETMILITAKRLDDERRAKGGDKRGKSAEYRWKWVENYCWKNGCQRSQNQCNDKWDNLLRDYKKVRDYETKIQAGQHSYWQLEKHERKERGLPSSLIIQIYDALHDIVDKRHIAPPPPPPPPPHAAVSLGMRFLPPPHHQASAAAAAEASSGSSERLGGDDPTRSPAKRMRKGGSSRGEEEGLGVLVARSASDLSQTLMQCEEKKERRHKDRLGFEERRLLLEETKTEIGRQGLEGLVGAVNNLANAILTLASDRSAD